MINDRFYIFSDGQVVESTEVSTNVINLAIANPNQGAGTRMTIRVVVSIVFDTCTSLQVAVQNGAGATPTAVLTTGPAVVLASLVVGFVVMEYILPATFAQYFRLNYIIAGSANVAGAVNAYMNMTN